MNIYFTIIIDILFEGRAKDGRSGQSGLGEGRERLQGPSQGLQAAVPRRNQTTQLVIFLH